MAQSNPFGFIAVGKDATGKDRGINLGNVSSWIFDTYVGGIPTQVTFTTIDGSTVVVTGEPAKHWYILHARLLTLEKHP